MPTIRVKMDDIQFNNLMALVENWANDPNRCDLVEVLETPEEERKKDIEIVVLKTTGAMTFDIWNEFCDHLKMKIPFPV